MDLLDKTLPCDACSGSFAWLTKEQAFFVEQGFNPPRRCTGARKARKASGKTERYEACPFGASGGPLADCRPRTPRGGASSSSPAVVSGPRSGQVVKVLPERGFGFVRDEEGHDYYFQQGDLLVPLGRLERGTRVKFDGLAAARGLRAQNVQLL